MGIQIDLAPSVNTSEILVFLAEYYRHHIMEMRIHQVSPEEDNRFALWLYNTATRLQIKCDWETEKRMLRAIYHKIGFHYTGEHFKCENDEEMPIVGQPAFCREYGCFDQVAAAQVEAFKDGSLLMSEHGGENGWHEINEYCPSHRQDTSPVLETIQVVDLSPDEKLWSRIVSWQAPDGPFWSQSVWLVDEGDYESGESIIPYASPWLGPCETREAAIQMAKDYDPDEEEFKRLSDLGEQAAMQREDEARDRWLRENS